MRTRRGSTFAEQLIVLVLSAILLSITSVGGSRLLDAITVAVSTREAADLLAFARDHAVASSRRTAVRFDAGLGRLIVHAGVDTLARANLRAASVVLRATRDSMAYAPSGLGVGAANMRLILSRGASSDTILISRLGRVRRGR